MEFLIDELATDSFVIRVDDNWELQRWLQANPLARMVGKLMRVKSRPGQLHALIYTYASADDRARAIATDAEAQFRDQKSYQRACLKNNSLAQARHRVARLNAQTDRAVGAEDLI